MAELNGHISPQNDDCEPPPENGRDMPSAQTRKKQKEIEVVNRVIGENRARLSVSLDLSKKALQHVPEDILHLKHLQYLYLEGNLLSCLPENFFDCLPHLCWLDLRNNYLVGLPNAYIGRHQCLRNLLLEGNQLRTLPLELGLVTTLTGLNIANNPLEFPPPEVIERGTQTILAFFQELLRAKSEGRVPPVPSLEALNIYDSDAAQSSGDEWSVPHTKSSSYRRSRYGRALRTGGTQQSRLLMSMSDGNAKCGDLPCPTPHSAALHTPTSQLQLRQLQRQQLKRAHALHSVLNANTPRRGKRGDRRLKRSSRYGEPPPPELVQQKYIEEKRLAKLRELKEKQDLILQRRRDQEMLKEFRDGSRELQQHKYMEKRLKGRLDYEQPAHQAPYDVAAEHMRIPTNEERIAQDIKAKHEKIRAMSPRSKARLDEARELRDRELGRKIKEHTAEMQERRSQPHGTPQQEMLAAQQELRVAENLQREIEARRKELEYRFTAFTGDVPARSKKTTLKY